MATMRENFSASVSESVNSPFPDLPGDFEVTRLRLADALGVMSPSQLLDETLALASSSSPSRRAQAARAASLLGFASDSSGLTVVLLLS